MLALRWGYSLVDQKDERMVDDSVVDLVDRKDN